MRGYEFFRLIGDDFPLARRLNGIMEKMNLMRIAAAPVTFRDSDIPEFHGAFFKCCLFEMWANGVVDRLSGWVSDIDEFLGEYQGSWKFYATCSHRDAVSDGFGDDEDYDEDGNSVERTLSDEDLCRYSIVGDLYFDDWRDIVQETGVNDLMWVKPMLQVNAEHDIIDVMKMTTGKSVQMYREVYDNDGDVVGMQPLTLEDRDLRKATEKVAADDDSAFILLLCRNVSWLCNTLRDMDRMQDNREALAQIRDISYNMLQLKF